MSRVIVPLEDARPSERARLGAKGARLADLVAAGAPVPAGFVISTEASRAYLEGGMSEALATPIREAYAALGGAVAVRSSLGGHDANESSFAGLFASFLDLRGEDAVLRAVEACWASLSSERVRAYGEERAGGRRLELAVIVQRMVPADVAGVLFTADPTGAQAGAILVESAWGLGQGIVTGRVIGDSFVLDKNSLRPRTKQIRRQPEMAVADGEGRVRLAPVPGPKQDAPTMTELALERLAREALRIRRHYGQEQDIEWAMAGQELAILQARPITSAAQTPGKRESGTIWSRRNIGDMFEGVLSPLGRSFALHYRDKVHAECLRAMGLREVGEPREYYREVAGHLYANVSCFSHLLSQTPLWRDLDVFARAFTSEAIDVRTIENPYGRFEGRRTLAESFAHWTRTQLLELATMQSRADKRLAAERAERERFDRLELARLSEAALGHELEHHLERFGAHYAAYMPIVFNAITAHGVLASLLGKWMGPEGRRLAALAEAKMSLPKWDAARIHALLGAPEGALERLLEEHGARGPQEMELSRPRWREDPSPITERLRAVSLDESARRALEAEARSFEFTLEAGSLGALSLPRRAAILGLSGVYTRLAELRLLSRGAVVSAIALVRRTILELARRLVAQGVLTSEAEIALVELPEIRDYLGHIRTAQQAFVRAHLDDRRRRLAEEQLAPPPPDSFVGEYRPEPPPDEGVLRGIGSSPGAVSGRARVIADFEADRHRFEPGEVLVARTTGAEWTPVLALAAGVITDQGSMLSHGSILSREYNLPSVVDTKIATSAIKTGDLVFIDADAGTVRIERKG